MLHMLLGDDAFYEALNRYLMRNINEVVNPSKLWKAFQPFMKNNITLETTMNDWIDTPGYPIVSVYLNSLTGVLDFYQVWKKLKSINSSRR